MCSFQLTILTVFLFSVSNANIFTCPKRSDDEFKVLNMNDSELIFAHVIYRHGDRNIGRLYPNDQYKEEFHWPGGYGALTNKGKQQQFKLGQYLRRRYGELLGNKYSPNKIYVQSTDYDRTIMSALSNLAGMFPPTDEEIWNENILWQPIPVHVVPPKRCQNFSIILEKHMNESLEIQRIYSQYAENFKHWTEESGTNITTFNDAKRLYKTLYMETVHNKTLKPWAKKAIEQNGIMEYISNYNFKLATHTPQLARLSTGFLIKEIFERISQKINKTLQPDRSVWVYSAHDSTIGNLLNSFGLFELHIPPYAATILIELYKNDDNEHYIQMFYRKSDEENPSPLSIPNCGTKCTLNQLYELYREIIPEDFESECGLP